MKFKEKVPSREDLWVTAQSRKIKIKEMTTAHLLSCIGMIQREDWRREYLSVLQEELEIRKTKLYNVLS